jgi:hypothetical protein
MSQWHAVENRTVNTADSNAESIDDNLSKHTNKRVKIDENEELPKFAKVSAHKEEFWEKENKVEFGWETSGHVKESVNDRVILKDNNLSCVNKQLEYNNEFDSTDRVELISKKSSKISGVLSPIDSQNIVHHPSNTKKIVTEKQINIKQEVSEHSFVHDNDVSADCQLFSENYANDICSNIHEESHYMDHKDEAKQNEVLNALSSWGSFSLPKLIKKKQRKRADPIIERERQNYECYKEYCKLFTIQTLIEKEMVQVRDDNIKYEKMLTIMNENKERHEDDLGYYLGIENDKKKRVRRLATEIERKHSWLVPKWPKAYGSEGSLNQHLIRKHPVVYEEWMKRILEKESQITNKKGQISREDKDKIRREIEKIAPELCKDDDSQLDDSD